MEYIRKESKSFAPMRAGEALKYAISKKPHSVLDVGSGGGLHAKAFVEAGARTTCVDYGTSVYARNVTYEDDIVKILGDFNVMNFDQKYDLVWASHVLEHQRNVGSFLDKLVTCCKENGTVVITVPRIHRRLLGGHLTLWSPGLLAYNVVLTGMDLRDAAIVEGAGEFSLVFTPKKFELPNNLTFDKNDIKKLSAFLPSFVIEGGDQHRTTQK